MTKVMEETIALEDMEFKPFISSEKIQIAVRTLAAELERDFIGKKPVFLTILNGAFRFASDLSRYIDMDSEWHFIKLSSYQGAQSTGEVKEWGQLSFSIEDRHVIILEDIIDTGTTMNYYISKLRMQNPASLSLASFLVKPGALAYPVSVEYRCFDISNEFVVGYGLDYNELGRNFNNLWQAVI